MLKVRHCDTCECHFNERIRGCDLAWAYGLSIFLALVIGFFSTASLAETDGVTHPPIKRLGDIPVWSVLVMLVGGVITSSIAGLAGFRFHSVGIGLATIFVTFIMMFFLGPAIFKQLE